MRIQSRTYTPDLRALKAADGKQARPSPPPKQMVKRYNMLSKKPQRILSAAVMVLIVLSALVRPWLMSKIRAKSHCWWLISELCESVCVCLWVWERYFGSEPQTTGDLETDYISEQRREGQRKDFILTHRRGKSQMMKFLSFCSIIRFLLKCWISWEISETTKIKHKWKPQKN